MSEDWPVVNINDLCEVVTKGTTPTSVGHQFTTNGVNFIKVESISSDGRVFKEKLAHISDDCHAKLKRSQILEGDILFSIAGALGRTAVVTADVLPANTNQALSIIRLKQDSGMYNRFLAYFLSSGPIIEQIENARGGAAQQNLSLAQVKAFQVPLPPLDEQKRIVSILDKAFEGLDRARANAEANLESNLELLASTITRETNTRWDARFCKPLGDICDLYQGLAINKKTKHLLVDKSSNPLLRIKDLRDGSEELYVDESGYPPNAKVDVNDIIYTRTGQIGLVFSGRRGVLHNNCFKVVPRAGIVREYLFWALQGHTFKKKIIDLASRAAQPDITHKLFKVQELAFPSVDEQRAAAEKITQVKGMVDRLHEKYRQQKQGAIQLRQSLLQKAFSGELT